MISLCTEKLAARDLRNTETRQAVLQILHTAEGPLSPPEIVRLCHAVGRKANKTTIYRDLVHMEAAGIVRKVIVSDRKQYFELSERGHHHHFICTQCEDIQDVEIDETSLVDRAKALAQQSSFQIDDHAIEFYGRCAACLPTVPQRQSV
jgi:Fur family transcriptional regulator, ferric uptake regulator